jgi:hypothetical protein
MYISEREKNHEFNKIDLIQNEILATQEADIRRIMV